MSTASIRTKGLTYRQLRVLGDGLAALLAEAEIAPNDRVLLLAENSVEFHALFVGVLRYGATMVTVNVEMNHAHLNEILGAVKPRMVIFQAGLGVQPLACSDAQRWLELGECEPDGGTGIFAEIARGATAPTFARSPVLSTTP